MNAIAIFAHGTYQGAWAACSASEASQMWADSVGHEGEITGLTFCFVTEAQVEALESWSAAGALADECPIDA
jgi:hypothetical protein